MSLIVFAALYFSALLCVNGYPMRWAFTGDARTNGNAYGAESLIESDSLVRSNGPDDYYAYTHGTGSSSGAEKSGGDLESWAQLGRWGSGKSGARASSVGDQTSVDFLSKVDLGWNGSLESRSQSSGTASGTGLTRVDLRSFVGLNGREGAGMAGASATGNQASSSVGATAAKATNQQLAVGSSGAASSVSTVGEGSARSHAAANDNSGAGLKVASMGSGSGALVVSGSLSNAALSNSNLSGKSHGYAKASGPGSSYASSAASLQIAKR